MASTKASESTTANDAFPARAHKSQHADWPYKSSDFARYDESPDDRFYASPRINIQHIDDNAIACLKRYYAAYLPQKGRIVDLCSSWTSHFPPETIHAVEKGDLHVFGVGMNDAELQANQHLNAGWVNHDLNADPQFPTNALSSPSSPDPQFDAATCVVSIDYLTKPREMLAHLRKTTKPDGTVHLVISDRRFPTKAVAIWERSSRDERLQIVGDYLHFAGWRDVEIVEVSKEEGGWLRRCDPLWVVRGVNKVDGDQG